MFFVASRTIAAVGGAVALLAMMFIVADQLPAGVGGGWVVGKGRRGKSADRETTWPRVHRPDGRAVRRAVGPRAGEAASQGTGPAVTLDARQTSLPVPDRRRPRLAALAGRPGKAEAATRPPPRATLVEKPGGLSTA